MVKELELRKAVEIVRVVELLETGMIPYKAPCRVFVEWAEKHGWLLLRSVPASSQRDNGQVETWLTPSGDKRKFCFDEDGLCVG